MMTFFGIPYERVVLGVVVLIALSSCYDLIIVDWLETHDPYVSAQTAIEVVVGVLSVLLIYLLAVQDVRISGVDSFMLLLVFFSSAGFMMAIGSKRRTSKMCKQRIR